MPQVQVSQPVKVSDPKLRAALGSATYALLRGVVLEAERQKLPIYLVGGFVRDLLLGRPSQDLDLLLEGSAIRFGRALVEKFGGRLVVHKPFGTAVWWLERRGFSGLPEFIDLISARSETYARPAALPSVIFDGIQADQYRRDFTINTLALRLDGPAAGQLLDPWGGLRDLKAGLLRTLHPQSFSDDPSRIFRLLRFAGRLGFKIESATDRHLKRYLSKIKLLSGERIRHELALVLNEEKRIAILRAAQQHGALRQVHSDLRFPSLATTLLKRHRFKPAPSYWDLPEEIESQLGFVLWLMFLSPRAAASIGERLRFETQLQAAVVSAAQLRVEARRLRSLTTSRLVARLEKEPLLAIYALSLSHKGTAFGRKLELFARRLRHIRPRFDGSDLRKLGVPPGPEYKKILGRLRAARLDGEVRTERQEQALLETLLHGSR